jgi:hypothetical protein
MEAKEHDSANEVVAAANRGDTPASAEAARGSVANIYPQPPQNGYRANQSETIGKLVEALAKAQLEFQPILKESENAAFKRGLKASKYASLDSVINATRPAMAKHGLVLIQLPHLDFDSKRLTLVSRLAHLSGEWMENELLLPAANTNQGFTVHSVASAITYARRYAWQSITGCVGEEDDDGNQAAEIGSKEAAQDVAKEKLEKAGVVPSLFYTWYDESQTARMTGSNELFDQTKELWRKHWDKNVGAVVLNAEQLEAMKYELEQRKIPFRPLKAK